MDVPHEQQMQRPKDSREDTGRPPVTEKNLLPLVATNPGVLAVPAKKPWPEAARLTVLSASSALLVLRVMIDFAPYPDRSASPLSLSLLVQLTNVTVAPRQAVGDEATSTVLCTSGGQGLLLLLRVLVAECWRVGANNANFVLLARCRGNLHAQSNPCTT